MSNILFYGPFNQRSRDTETLMLAFKKQAHNIKFLTQFEGKDIIPFLKEHGIETYSHQVASKSTFLYFLKHMFFLIRFCWRNKIDIVYSHLEPGNFVASVVQYLIPAKVYICRHHVNEGQLYKFDKDFYYDLTYKLARNIIVVSDKAKQFMIEVEKINPVKIAQINLAYNFELYSKPSIIGAENIRKEMDCSILLLTISRLTKYKRPEVSIQVLKKLLMKGLDAKLIILGHGEMLSQLKELIINENLQEHAFLLGYVNNVPDYLLASDYLLHPSLLDSSCVAVKEAGLIKKPVIVCKGVGDFDMLIKDDENGFLIDPDDFSRKAAAIVLATHNDKRKLEEVGKHLHLDVVEKFSIDSVLPNYNQFNEK